MTRHGLSPMVDCTCSNMPAPFYALRIIACFNSDSNNQVYSAENLLWPVLSSPVYRFKVFSYLHRNILKRMHTIETITSTIAFKTNKI